MLVLGAKKSPLRYRLRLLLGRKRFTHPVKKTEISKVKPQTSQSLSQKRREEPRADSSLVAKAPVWSSKGWGSTSTCILYIIGRRLHPQAAQQTGAGQSHPDQMSILDLHNTVSPRGSLRHIGSREKIWFSQTDIFSINKQEFLTSSSWGQTRISTLAQSICLILCWEQNSSNTTLLSHFPRVWKTIASHPSFE